MEVKTRDKKPLTPEQIEKLKAIKETQKLTGQIINKDNDHRDPKPKR